ncbi:Serine--tRNA ligase [Beauveria bassiana D1-5]|uniref:Seryl-tRNA(Ser) synthetase n=1 Tax=Beauveria bassiana D1-5 TaxID=1245745 RepID=A0A0A2W1P9_BEABA|nr:Serine--tRNA ligase [Beauveria bassiana D1-5]
MEPDDAAAGVPSLVLAGTSEIPLAGMKAMMTLDTADLPLKRVAVSRCYRAEAGARGASTRGLYRVHEFTKVEMLAWTRADADAAQDVFDEMLDLQTEILGSLGLARPRARDACHPQSRHGSLVPEPARAQRRLGRGLVGQHLHRLPDAASADARAARRPLGRWQRRRRRRGCGRWVPLDTKWHGAGGAARPGRAARGRLG